MPRLIDLSGPEGNAFALMAMAERFGKQMGLDTNSLLLDMRSGDYDHLVKVFEQHFGLVCTLINKPWEDEDEEGE